MQWVPSALFLFLLLNNSFYALHLIQYKNLYFLACYIFAALHNHLKFNESVVS